MEMSNGVKRGRWCEAAFPNFHAWFQGYETHWWHDLFITRLLSRKAKLVSLYSIIKTINNLKIPFQCDQTHLKPPLYILV